MSSSNPRINGMRDEIKKAYNNAPKWVAKVNRMPDTQILPLYHSLVKSGKLRNPTWQ